MHEGKYQRFILMHAPFSDLPSDITQKEKIYNSESEYLHIFIRENSESLCSYKMPRFGTRIRHANGIPKNFQIGFFFLNIPQMNNIRIPKLSVFRFFRKTSESDYEETPLRYDEFYVPYSRVFDKISIQDQTAGNK